jgi:hypothetical protein
MRQQIERRGKGEKAYPGICFEKRSFPKLQTPRNVWQQEEINQNVEGSEKSMACIGNEL